MARPENPVEQDEVGNLYLGSKIRELRHHKGMNLAELAKLVSRTEATISKIETNNAKPSVITLQRVAGALGTTLEELRKSPLHPRLVVEVHEQSEASSTVDVRILDELTTIRKLLEEITGTVTILQEGAKANTADIQKIQRLLRSGRIYGEE